MPREPSKRLIAKLGKDAQVDIVNSMMHDKENINAPRSLRKAKTKAMDNKIWVGAAPTGNHDQPTPGPSKKPAVSNGRRVGRELENSAYLERYLFGFLPRVSVDRYQEDSDSEDLQDSDPESDIGDSPRSVPIKLTRKKKQPEYKRNGLEDPKNSKERQDVLED